VFLFTSSVRNLKISNVKLLTLQRLARYEWKRFLYLYYFFAHYVTPGPEIIIKISYIRMYFGVITIILYIYIE